MPSRQFPGILTSIISTASPADCVNHQEFFRSSQNGNHLFIPIPYSEMASRRSKRLIPLGLPVENMGPHRCDERHWECALRRVVSLGRKVVLCVWE